MNYIYVMWQVIQTIQAKEDNCIANINNVTDNKVDVSLIE